MKAKICTLAIIAASLNIWLDIALGEYSRINFDSMALGIAVCVLIYLYRVRERA